MGTSFFSGCRSIPGTMPATSQLLRLISTTAMTVVACSSAIGDLLKSPGRGIWILLCCIRRRIVSTHRRVPHSILAAWPDGHPNHTRAYTVRRNRISTTSGDANPVANLPPATEQQAWIHHCGPQLL